MKKYYNICLVFRLTSLLLSFLFTYLSLYYIVCICLVLFILSYIIEVYLYFQYKQVVALISIMQKAIQSKESDSDISKVMNDLKSGLTRTGRFIYRKEFNGKL